MPIIHATRIMPSAPLTIPVIALASLFAYASPTKVSANADQALCDATMLNTVHLSINNEIMSELAARLERKSGIRITVSASLTAVPISADIEAESWADALAILFEDYSTAVNASAEGCVQAIYLMGGAVGTTLARDRDEKTIQAPLGTSPQHDNPNPEGSNRNDRTIFGDTRRSKSQQTTRGNEAEREAAPNPFGQLIKERSNTDNRDDSSADNSAASDAFLEALNANNNRIAHEPSPAETEFLERLKSHSNPIESMDSADDTSSQTLLELLQQQSE